MRRVSPCLLVALLVVYGFIPGVSQAQPATPVVNMTAEELAIERFARPSRLRRWWNGQMPSIDIAAQFDWSMQKRYGLDRNMNGVIDLPNSTEYVLNLPSWHTSLGCPLRAPTPGAPAVPQFRVNLDASASTMPPIEPPHGSGPRLEDDGTRVDHGADLPAHSGADLPSLPSADIDVMASEFRLGQQYLEWTIKGPALAEPLVQTTPFHTDRRTLSVCLQEGRYEVKLAAKDDWSGKQDTTSMSVRVRDILVAQLGDSFASGNGVPEWRAQSLIEQVSGIESARVGLAKSLASALLMGRHDQDVDVKTVWADVDGPWVPPPSAISKTIRIETLLDLEIAAGVLGRSIASECRSSPLNCGQALLQGALGVSNFNVTLKPDAKLPNYETMTKMHKQHYLSHRSSYAPGSLVALALEDASDKTSVTFVNLAMTGATVNLGLLGGNKGIKTERFYDDNFMDPQLDQLEKIANGRSIDALLLSIGGNDAGFKNVLTGLVARERGEGELDLIGPTYAQLEAGVHGGHWDAIENQIPDILSLLKSTFEWGELAGLDSLPGLYVQTRQRMEALGLNVRRTYITEYPDMTRNGQGETCAQILNTIHSGYPPGGMEIKKEELEWLQSHVAVPLNNTVHEAEVTNSWKYVDGIYAGSRLHGLCAPRPYNPMEFNIHIRHVPIEVPAECRTALGMPPGGMIRPACDNTWDSGVCSPSPVRWYRDENEGAVIENRSLEDSIIMVHPNEYGQALVAEAVIRALCHDLQ